MHRALSGGTTTRLVPCLSGMGVDQLLAVSISDQGDGCTACPSLQGTMTDMVGLPGRPGPKGEQGPEGVGQPGKAVSADCLPLLLPLPGCCLPLPQPAMGTPRIHPLYFLGPAWSTRSPRTPRSEGHTGMCEAGGDLDCSYARWGDVWSQVGNGGRY